MNRLVLVAGLFCVVMASPAAAQRIKQTISDDAGYAAGRAAGRDAFTGTSALLGFVGGVVGGVSFPVVLTGTNEQETFVVGSAISVAAFVGALRLGTHIPRSQARRIQNEPAEFREEFQRGYTDELRRRRVEPTILGGLIGGAMGVTFVWWASQVLGT